MSVTRRATFMSTCLAFVLAGGSGRTIGPVEFNRYHTHAEFTEILQAVARDYPNLVSLEEA